MLHSVLACGRSIVRAFISSENQRFSTLHQKANQQQNVHLLSAVAGFSKRLNPNSSNDKGTHTSKWSYGEDAYFLADHQTACVMGVADGVGGWREYGVDPSQVPQAIMSICARLVDSGRFKPCSPDILLERSYEEATLHKEAVIGSTTACIVSLDVGDRKLYTANLGDSGYMVIRNGKILARSQEQQHYFNSPFQLTMVPPAYRGRVISDSASDAVKYSLDVLEGDIILLATDGLFDNMTDSMILRHLQAVKHRQRETIQSAANTIANEARKLSNDPDYVSPFARAAANNGYVVKGGKPDDITVLIATVNSGELGEFSGPF